MPRINSPEELEEIQTRNRSPKEIRKPLHFNMCRMPVALPPVQVKSLPPS